MATAPVSSTDEAWSELDGLWGRITSGDTARQTISDPAWPAGKALEYLIIRGFELSGAEVRPPYSVTLDIGVNEQIDGAVHVGSMSCLIESKDRGGERINADPIAKLRNQLMRRHSSVFGVLFSRSGFTAPAVTMAHFISPQAILLWDGPEIGRALANRDFVSPLRLKYRANIEMGMPDYNILEANLS